MNTTGEDRTAGGEAAANVEVHVEGAVALVRLHRPDRRNAFDDRMAGDLATAFERLAADDAVRVVILGGTGTVFCAGGDLAWMKRAASYGPEENLRDAEAFQRAFERIDRCPKPVVGRVHGAAMGGGVGLVAACDVVVAAEGTTFALPEVRLGLVPGVVAPYVIRKVGAGHARRLFLTGERFDAAEALRIGLVHRVAAESGLDAAVTAVVKDLLAGAPDGQRRAKELTRAIEHAPAPETAAALARQAIADARASADGREGIAAFLEKRKARWAP